MKIALYHLVFFVLIRDFTILFENFRVFKILILLITLFVFSLFNISYLISKKSKIFKHSVYLTLSLVLFFELSKFTAYLMGFLPRYFDVPWGSSFLFSTLSMALYTYCLWVIIQFKVIRNNKLIISLYSIK